MNFKDIVDWNCEVEHCYKYKEVPSKACERRLDIVNNLDSNFGLMEEDDPVENQRETAFKQALFSDSGCDLT